jgi:hypothetical protein
MNFALELQKKLGLFIKVNCQSLEKNKKIKKIIITLSYYHLSYNGIFFIHGYQSLAMSTTIAFPTATQGWEVLPPCCHLYCLRA